MSYKKLENGFWLFKKEKKLHPFMLWISIFLKLTPLDFQSILSWPGISLALNPLEIHVFFLRLSWTPWNILLLYPLEYFIDILNRRLRIFFSRKANKIDKVNSHLTFSDCHKVLRFAEMKARSQACSFKVWHLFSLKVNFGHN